MTNASSNVDVAASALTALIATNRRDLATAGEGPCKAPKRHSPECEPQSDANRSCIRDGLGCVAGHAKRLRRS